LSRLTPVTAVVTVIVEVAVKPPSAVVAVITAVPGAIPVTRPLELTVATAVLPLDQATAMLVALVGATVAVSCWVLPIAMLALVGLKLTPVTDTFFTVTAQLALKPPSELVTFTLVVPALGALTRPVEETLATALSELDQVTALFVASLGVNRALI